MQSVHRRHPNRSPRGSLSADRRAIPTSADINRIEIPVVKIGRFVEFGGAENEFPEYLDRIKGGENRKGIAKGWFSIVRGNIFVEYADLTASLHEMLRRSVRPRSFNAAVTSVIDNLRSGIRSAADADREQVEHANVQRAEAVRYAIENDDHATDIEEYPWMYDDRSSRWGSSVFKLLSQPKVISQNTSKGSLLYGFPIEQGLEDQFVRSDVISLVGGVGLTVPGQLKDGVRPRLPILELHRELSGMRGGEPVLSAPPDAHLGPLEIHSF